MLEKETERIGVIGAGLGGLAAACTLAARGHAVTVFEKNEWLGGKAASLERDGFRFDMGPTILTVPSVLRRIFSEAGERMEDHLDLVRCDPQWRCFFDGGDVLDLWQEVGRMGEELERFAPGSAEGYRRFMSFSKRLDEISQRFFFWKSVGSMRDTFEMKGSFQASVLADVMNLGLGRSVYSSVRKHVPDERVAQMLDHFTQYVGSAPDQSPAVLCSIAHMQTNEGVWYPMGGTRAVPVALEALARRLGVEFRTGVDVARVLVDGDRVRGIRTRSGEDVPLRAVVSNSDAFRTYEELVEGRRAARVARKMRGREPACSGVVLYLGLDRRYDHLLHHNFVFSKNAEAEFEDIYRAGVPAAEPSAYVCAPTRSGDDVAPAGMDALYVLVHAPHLRPGQDWSKMLPGYREVILDLLEERVGMTNLRDHIVMEEALTPQDIHERYRVLDGAIYGVASHGKFNGAFKPANRSRAVKGLYLAGGAAHPGPGMPMVLMSGWIAADCVDGDRAADGPAVPAA